MHLDTRYTLMLHRTYEDPELQRIVTWLVQEYKQPVRVYAENISYLNLDIFLPNMAFYITAYALIFSLWFGAFLPLPIFVLSLVGLGILFVRFIIKASYTSYFKSRDPEIEIEPGYKLTLRTWSSDKDYGKSQLVTELDHLPDNFIDLMRSIEKYKSSVTKFDFISEQLDIENDLKYRPLKKAAMDEVNKLL